MCGRTPQRLKSFLLGAYGVAEAMPFPDRRGVMEAGLPGKQTLHGAVRFQGPPGCAAKQKATLSSVALPYCR